MSGLDDSLFREEAIAAKQNRLHGEVMLKQPLSTKVMVAVIVLCIAITALWITTGTYARTEQVRGILVTTQPTSKVFVPRPGIVTELDVTEGTLVDAGDRLAVVHTDLADESGREPPPLASALSNSAWHSLSSKQALSKVAQQRNAPVYRSC